MASQVMTNAENNQNDDGDGVNSDQECVNMGHIICDLNSSDNDDVIYQEYEEQYRQVFNSLKQGNVQSPNLTKEMTTCLIRSLLAVVLILVV